MEDILVTGRTLEQTPAGSIFAISFSGNYPQGSEGNAPCAKMIRWASALIAQNRPAALLFDLTNLSYRWGDSIGGGLIALALDRPRHAFLPACLVARGRTARALVGFISSGLAQAGIATFESEEHALSFLRAKLSEQAV